MTKPTKEVRALARVICSSEGYVFDDLHKTEEEVILAVAYDGLPPIFFNRRIYQEWYIKQAIAVLKHLRDNPSDRMILAGSMQVGGFHGTGAARKFARERWQAMHNVALGEE